MNIIESKNLKPNRNQATRHDANTSILTAVVCVSRDLSVLNCDSVDFCDLTDHKKS